MKKHALHRILTLLTLSIAGVSLATPASAWNNPICDHGVIKHLEMGQPGATDTAFYDYLRTHQGSFEMGPGDVCLLPATPDPTPAAPTPPLATPTPGAAPASPTTAPGSAAASTSTPSPGNGSAASTSIPTGPTSSTTAPGNQQPSQSGRTPDQTEIWYCLQRVPSKESPTGLVNVPVHRDGIMAYSNQIVFWVIPGRSPAEQACTEQQIREGLTPKPPPSSTLPVSGPSVTTTITIIHQTPETPASPSTPLQDTSTETMDTTTTPSTEVISEQPMCLRTDENGTLYEVDCAAPTPVVQQETPSFVLPPPPAALPLPPGCKDERLCGLGLG